ncbi:unnamed protein product [Vitrella brassicaformis CCMP3155]|uniref:Uncharacterized protein n=1 Tax=Vitrella brassicaformis (strain CCMP3155) TaxID=1169540 RepID=A0A0G4G7C2_VITBC|nr:unnamed protein product [Vitrella brassicaformis CCMP3155]|eukprot:CEM24567.1 unnamed protein product [Vitrella brassicaformis CCMP3155]
MGLSVPDNMDTSSACELIREGISSIVDGVRGLERLTLYVYGGAAQKGLLSVTIASTDSKLYIRSGLGVAASRLLAEKMPSKIKEVTFGRHVSAADRRSVLEEVGAGREVGLVTVGEQYGALDGWRSDSFPSIRGVAIVLSVPDGLEASAAAERIRDGISSIVSDVRGLERLTVDAYSGAGQQRSSSVTIASTDSELHIYSALGVTVGRLLAEKMPSKVKEVMFEPTVSPEGRRSVLEGLGVEREVGTVRLTGPSVSLTEGALDGWQSDNFPSIGHVRIGEAYTMDVEVPNNLEASAAAELIHGGISSIVGGVRGLKCLTLRVRGSNAADAAIRQLLRTEVFAHFTIDTRERRWRWGRNFRWSSYAIELTATRRS